MQRIVLAEDDFVTRTVLVEQLSGIGYDVVACSNGREALDVLLRDDSIDLLLTDIRMPEMDGTDLIETLRKEPALKTLPVIIMSGVVGIKDISALLQQGASRFLAKPIDPKDLQQTIEQALAVPHS